MQSSSLDFLISGSDTMSGEETLLKFVLLFSEKAAAAIKSSNDLYNMLILI